jgi:DNA segregation ATPase FtsK/SpoIIIE, S-DNA-T family
VPNEAPAAPSRGERLRDEIFAGALLLTALFVAGALLFETAISPEQCGATARVFGPVGACGRGLAAFLVGLPAAALLAIIPAVHALRLFGRMAHTSDRRWMAFFTCLLLLVPVGVSMLRGAPREVDAWAGVLGNFAGFYLRAWFGPGGAWLVWLVLLSAASAATLWWNPVRAVVGVAGAKKVGLSAAAERALELAPPPEELPAIEPLAVVAPPAMKAPVAPVPAAEDEEDDDANTADDAPKAKRAKKGKAPKVVDDEPESPDDLAAAAIAAMAEYPELPPTTLLDAPPPTRTDAQAKELDTNGQRLMDALRTFKIDGTLAGRTTGPTVTQYEIEPAPGVKVRQIASLANDLALAMRAPSIRIVAPIPGRGAVGVEVPNPTPEMVGFRELLEARDFQQARAALPIALGKDLEGRVVVADLAKMPHLLIAGATGSGKSVCVNTIITSLVYRHTPETLRFLMVDPKMVELSVYNQLPHLRHKVITDNRDAAAVLKWAVMEMQERYALLAENGCRNLADFNQRVQAGTELRVPKDPNVAFSNTRYEGKILPYIVVVIDEMADLMMTVQGEVETPIAMLAQKARAIGIHLILATQRPSVNVITGLIKANFPSRIAFRVASQVDSRTIIDGAGAEALLGNGDMLFIPPGKSEPSRLQGAFLSSDETERLMAWFRDVKEARKARMEARGLAVSDGSSEGDILQKVRDREAMERAAADGEGGPAEDAGPRDKLFREAAEVCVQHSQGSTSLLQRRLNVGYGRAARIIDQLHEAGVLGPPNGSKPRDVLVGLEDLDRIAPKSGV